MNLPNPPELLTWIGGTAEPSTVIDGSWLYDPNTGKRLAESRKSSPEQVDRAITAADAAHRSGVWQSLGVTGRAPFLMALADLLDDDAERIAQLDATNSGVPIDVTRLFAGSNGATMRAAVERALSLGDSTPVRADGRTVTVHRVPWGPTALLMPWNAPSAMAVKKLSYALISGATVVMKPSSASPWSTELIAAACTAVGIPAGVVSLVLGSVGEQLVSDPRIRAIAMTGSTPTGREISAKAGPNFTRLRLELGSNNPAIVRADADMAETADLLVSGAMKMSGQWCEAPRRVIVASDRLEELVEALVASLHSLRIGSSLEAGIELGPVAFAGRMDELERQRERLRREGARIIEVSGQRGSYSEPGGWFFTPTIAVGDDIALDLEIFGPMITVQPARDDEHAIELANAGQVGLSGYVFGRDVEAAAAIGKRIEAGEVKINGTSALDMSPDSVQSFFGDSGIGGHGDADVLSFFTGNRIVGTDMPGLPL